MRKILLVLALALPLGACSFDDLKNVFTASTASISNPVTPTMLYDAESGMTIAFAGLKAYKQSCVQGLIPMSCRGVIQNIQVYTRKLPPLLASARAFVRNNDQVNAVVAYNTILGLIADFKSVASANNIQVQ